MSDKRFEKDGCNGVRLTLDLDMRTKKGLDLAMHAVRRAGDNCLLMGSLPCTWGSTLQEMNEHLPNHRSRMSQLYNEYLMLIENFTILARQVLDQGGEVLFEWPRFNKLWGRKPTHDMINELQLKIVDFDGCRFNLRSARGKKILKPWRFITSCEEIEERFDGVMCNCPKGTHDQCCGKNASPTN